MNRFLYQITIALLFSILYIVMRTPVIFAQFEPPEKVTLTMYRLVQDGEMAGAIAQPATQCTTNNVDVAKSYGCTAITDSNVYSYPFSSSTITISIDGRQVSLSQ